MTLERVVSVTTFTNDNQVTTTTSGPRRPTSLSYIDQDRGYSTVPRNSPHKSPDIGFSNLVGLTTTVSEDPICRTVSQQSFLRTASTKAIPSPSTDDIRHQNPRDFQNNHRRHRRQQISQPHHHRPISNAISSPACNSNYQQSFNSNSNTHRTPSDFQNNNHIDESSSTHRHRRQHHHHQRNDHVANSDCPRSRYRKHESSGSKHAGSSSGNTRHHRHHSREYVLDFPKVKKAHSESALCVDRHHGEESDSNGYYCQRERRMRRDHSAHSSSRPDCNGNPPTPTTTTGVTTYNSDSGRRPHQRRRRCSSSPESPKQPKACALSYVFPWSQRNRNNRRHQRSQSRHHTSRPSSRERCRRDLDDQFLSVSNKETNPTLSQTSKRLSTARPLSITPAQTNGHSQNHELISSRFSPDTDFPPTPKSAPVRSPFRLTDPYKSTELADFPLSPKSAPAFQFDFTPDDDSEEEFEAENHRRHHYVSRRHHTSYQRSSDHQSNDKTYRSRSEQRYKSPINHLVIRDKSEDAFNKGSDPEDLDNTNNPIFDSKTSLRDSNGRLYTSNNQGRSRSNHSSTFNNRERHRDHHRAVSSSGTTSERAKSRQSHSRSKSRPSRTEYQGAEEDSQGQNTEESSTDCSTRKIQRATLKPVDLDPRIDSFGKYVSEVDKLVINDAEDFEYRPTDMKGPLHLSFCGCGFLGMYHLGVVSSLTQRGPSFLEKIKKFGGASAGALTAALLVLAPEKAEESVIYFHNLSKEIRSKPFGALTPGYTLTKTLRIMLDDALPEEAHLDASGRLFISLTNGTTKKNEIWSHYESREELLEVLLASCFIPLYAGSRLPVIRGKRYMDGGLTNNLVQFNSGRTITVSPFDGKSDIGPKAGHEASKKAHFINFHNQNIQMNFQNLRRGAHVFFPPRRPVLQEYFDKGRLDASRFLIREGLYEIDVPQQTKSVVYESSV